MLQFGQDQWVQQISSYTTATLERDNVTLPRQCCQEMEAMCANMVMERDAVINALPELFDCKTSYSLSVLIH